VSVNLNRKNKGGRKAMNTLEFLTQLNTATKEWGLWISRDNPIEHHIGHYSFEHDCMPRRFIHVGSLEELAHLRQHYILDNTSSVKNEEVLGKEWAENFLSRWQARWLVTA
jgi:hypothetical protein